MNQTRAPTSFDKSMVLLKLPGTKLEEYLDRFAMLGPESRAYASALLERLSYYLVTSACLGIIIYILLRKLVHRDSRTSFSILKQDVGSGDFLRYLPGIHTLLPIKNLGDHSLPQATQMVLYQLRAPQLSWLPSLNPLEWKILQKKTPEMKHEYDIYQAGEPYGDAKVEEASIAEDLRRIGLKLEPQKLANLFEKMRSVGKPLDDRQMTMEKIIAIITALPQNSKTRKKGTGVIIDALWSSLQHPPLSYLGDKYQYRTPDGSYNNPLMPDLGKAGTHYAKSVKKLKCLSGTPPDPGMLFDFLMCRNEATFRENPAGVSSMLFYHATIIIHDVFCSNRFDNRISDTSSYLDLAPLYGSSLDDQLKIRTMERGLLKPDTFSEKRLLGQPPGVNVILVMYSRFHNYVADTLLKINEYGRFSLPNTTSEEQKKAALVKQDNDLFQTARLIVGGLYINICLHDYLRGLTNTHHSDSSWTLDPRVDVDRTFDSEGVPKGCGNQVSAEFNLLYRFHSTISLRDEKWLNEFFQNLFPDLKKPFDQLTPMEFVQGLYRFEQSIPKEPEKREFGGIKRGVDGKFNDADLVKVLKDSMEDPAGLFGARMVPKALKMVEIAGILSARSWQLASLNECRAFFGLKKHEKFEDINPDPEVADLLRKFYHHPDMVEIYPGLFLEDGKPRMDPGCGGCPPYTVGRAVFSDAVSLVRSDRFYTLDYTASTLTNWGMKEVQQDLRILGGSMFYKLIQRTLPGWFPYNSLHAMQPMFTRKMNEQIAHEIGTISLYTTADPAPPPRPVIITRLSTIRKVLSDPVRFTVLWSENFNNIFLGKRDFSGLMLAGDKSANFKQRNLVGDLLYATPEISKLINDTTISLANELIRSKTMNMGMSVLQLDIIRDVVIPLNTRIMSDLWYLDLNTPENPMGTLSTTDMYKHLIDARTWGFENFDPAMSWQRRLWAQDAVKVLDSTTRRIVTELLGKHDRTLSLTELARNAIFGRSSSKDAAHTTSEQSEAASLRWFGSKLVLEMAAAGTKVDEIIDILWPVAIGGVGVTVGLFADVLSFFLRPENSGLWATVIEIVSSASKSEDDSANRQLRQYVLEAQRLTSYMKDVRVCQEDVLLDDMKLKKGDKIIVLTGVGGRMAENVPDPEAFLLDRPIDMYLQFGHGPHRCLGREIAITFVTALIKVTANLKSLRPAPGLMGAMKSIKQGTDKYYLNDSWSHLTTHPTTWTVHYEGVGKGIYQPASGNSTAGQNLNEIFVKLKEQAKSNDVAPLPKDPNDGSHFPPAPIALKDPEAKNIINGTISIPNGAPGPPANFVEQSKVDTKLVNGNKPDESKIQQGIITPTITLVSSKEARIIEQSVKFGNAFSTPPRVVLGIQTLDIDFLESAPNISVDASNVTETGFTLVVRTASPKIWSLVVAWMAVPFEGSFKDIHTMTFDTRQVEKSSWSETENRRTIMQSYDFSDLRGASYTGKPKAITWLSGIQLQQSSSIRYKAHRLRGYIAKIDSASCTVAVETNDAAAFDAAQINVLFVPQDSPLAMNYINPEDTTVVKPIANEMSLKYKPEAGIDSAKKHQSIIACEGWDFATVGGSSIRYSTKTEELKGDIGGEQEATIATWYDCKANGIWAWAITSSN